MSVNHNQSRLFRRWTLVLLLAIGIVASAWLVLAKTPVSTAQSLQPSQTEQLYLPVVIGSRPMGNTYALLGWNDLGMHCYNKDFSNLGVLPPFNNLWVQVIRRGDPPQIVTTGISVSYAFPENTYSVGKSNFWDNAKALFGVDLAPNIGLTGNGLAGSMDAQGDHFEAVGIPLTEYNDNDHLTRQPYQLATLIVRDDQSGSVIATNQVVAPVSTEMHCDFCHSDNGQGNEGIATGVVETNILTKHDLENMEEYPTGHTGALMSRRPILCAECHSSNALGPFGLGVPGLPSLSHAIHSKHAEEGVPSTMEGCYSCHPGPATRCLRDIMSQRNLTCISCHEGLLEVSLNPNPWNHEPRCDDCHDDPTLAQDQALYRLSKGHGGVYCEGCHDSTHAIAPSTQPRDAIKFVNLQGHAGTLQECTVCHLTQPASGGPHTNSDQ